MDLRVIVGLLQSLHQLRTHDHWSRPQLLAFQAESLTGLREFAVSEIPVLQTIPPGHVRSAA